VIWRRKYVNFIYDFGDIVMMRKCLLGINARAEAHYHNLDHNFS